MEHITMTAANLVLNALSIILLVFICWGAKKLTEAVTDLQQAVKKILNGT